nr:MAG TPA_asm: major capsid protein [Caudoviricetes sp.]
MTDLISPAELTGYARESLEDYEQSKGTLAHWLPNRYVADIVAKFVVGRNGLVPEASFRAYGAAPELGKYQPGRRVILELPALGQNIPLDEYWKLRARNASDDAIVRHIQDQARAVVRAVSDRIEALRGTVLVTGKATIDQDNFKSEDDFGRDADLEVAPNTLWTDPDALVLEDLLAWAAKYEEQNGTLPGTILTSSRVAALLTRAAQFQTALLGGATRPASRDDVNAVLVGQGLPSIQVYDRRTFSGRVVPDDVVLLLPPAVDVNNYEGTELGASFWGLTESANKPDWDIAESEQPGVVVASFEGEKPGEPTEIISDAIALPVLANPDLSLVATVA